MSQTIRVVVVDDSALMRRVITALLEQDPAIRVVGTAADGREAIELVARLRPDVVTMDVWMPVMDGVAATEQLMAYCPTPILVLTSSLGRHEVDITFKMLGAGALEVMEKPSNGAAGALEQARGELIRRIKLLSRVKVVTHLRGRRRTAAESPRATPGVRTPERPRIFTAVPATGTAGERLRSHALAAPFPLIVIGASTGGPRVIYRILADLPANLNAAILVVQHIAGGFSLGLAEWFANASTLPVGLLAEGDVLRAGRIFVAPDRHDTLILRDGRVHLSDNPLLLQRPSIDVAMQAAADVFGARTIGVLLTGMGRDGAYGLLRIRRSGGHTIAQDEASCTIFGMPRAAIELGAAAEVLTAKEIAARLLEAVATLNAGDAPAR